MIEKREDKLDPRCRKLLQLWPALKKDYAADEYVVDVRGKALHTKIISHTLSNTRIPKVSLPRYQDEGEILRFLLEENVPGKFPYTAGVFAFKREGEDPTRMFAGEGAPISYQSSFQIPV